MGRLSRDAVSIALNFRSFYLFVENFFLNSSFINTWRIWRFFSLVFIVRISGVVYIYLFIFRACFILFGFTGGWRGKLWWSFVKISFRLLMIEWEKVRKFLRDEQFISRGWKRRGGTVLMGRLSCNLRRIFILFRGFLVQFYFIYICGDRENHDGERCG